ncbi:MAG: hypothetical protein JJT75_07935 [Opitutales bacterium]|nr:hypothetical protein [Opitutales bacterium]
MKKCIIILIVVFMFGCESRYKDIERGKFRDPIVVDNESKIKTFKAFHRAGHFRDGVTYVRLTSDSSKAFSADWRDDDRYTLSTSDSMKAKERLLFNHGKLNDYTNEVHNKAWIPDAFIPHEEWNFGFSEDHLLRLITVGEDTETGIEYLYMVILQ